MKSVYIFTEQAEVEYLQKRYCLSIVAQYTFDFPSKAPQVPPSCPPLPTVSSA